MSRRSETEAAALLAQLAGDPEARLVAANGGRYRLATSSGSRACAIAEATVRRLCGSGLLTETEPGRFAAAAVASAWLKRRMGPEHPFRMQHGRVVEGRAGNDGARTLIDLDESPVATLARKPGKDGEPWLKPHALVAAERLRRDFEVGRLQPRVTANWSASVSSGRRSGDGSGIADLTDMALAARIRFDEAMRAIGPDLSGILVDVCCFLKGLESVERERRWPARSAKLVLRIALEGLARHYGLTETASGRAGGKLRQWGTADYRPEIS